MQPHAYSCIGSTADQQFRLKEPKEASDEHVKM
jgi:hypothetical protein